MNTRTAADPYPTSTPDATGDCGDHDDTRQVAPEPDDRDVDEPGCEDGYGYGV
jgi:hypothetical protein